MTVGVCDWGIGGLGFYQRLREARPDLDVVYFGDQGVPGYGKLPRPVLTARLRKVFEAFRDLGVEEVVVACNAASTALNEARVLGVRTTGMIRPTLDSLQEPDDAAIGVIGGRRTILSGAYARPLRASGWTVRNRIAQPLSGLIEAGDRVGAEAALEPILRPLADVRTLVLACTHYIVLDEAIRTRLPQARLVDPAVLAWAQVAPTLPPARKEVGTTRFLTTGDPAEMARSARLAFGVDCDPEPIVIRG